MNTQGIFCFALLLAFAAMEINFLNESAAAKQKIFGTEKVLFEAEILSATRTIAENGVDAVTEEGLRQGVQAELEPDEVKKAVNKRLAFLFSEMEKNSDERASISFEEESLSEKFLNENSSVIVVKKEELVSVAEYSFTGGLLKDKKVKAKIFGKNAKQEFKIPAGYTIRVVVLG